jgi:hypothetical protein
MFGPDEKNNLKKVIEDIATQYQVIDDRREAIKDVIKNTAGKYNITKKTLSRMAKTYYKGNFDDIANESDEFTDLYTAVIVERN